MKHQWKTRSDGELVDDDSDHPRAVCAVCGEVSACLHSQEPGYSCWADDGPKLEDDGCKGVDLTVEVVVTIRHPGKAEAADDRSSVSQAWRVPVANLLDAQADLVRAELRHLAEAMAKQWRIAISAHHEDWERAVDAAEAGEVSQCP